MVWGGRKGVGRPRKREKAPGLWGRGNARVGACPGVGVTKTV